MAKKGEYFTRIFKHYMIKALDRTSAAIEQNRHTELNHACKDLLEALNPEVEPEEPKEPFAIAICDNGQNYLVYHRDTNRDMGFHYTQPAAQEACHWLNERYDR